MGAGRLIGLGESIHTSGGFYAAKDRLIRALIDEHGVRVFAMETPRDDARSVDDYLVSGDCERPANQVLTGRRRRRPGRRARRLQRDLRRHAARRLRRLPGRAPLLGFRAWQDESQFYGTDIGRANEARDVAMGAVFAEVLDLDFTPDARVAVWAHNFHLSMRHTEVGGSVLSGVRTFGTVVARHQLAGRRYGRTHQ